MIWSRKVICSGSDIAADGCGTELLVTEKELYQVTGTDFDDTRVSAIIFCCSHCGIETAVMDVGCVPRGSRPSKEQRQALHAAQNG